MVIKKWFRSVWRNDSQKKGGSPAYRVRNPRIHTRYTIERHKRKIMSRFSSRTKEPFNASITEVYHNEGTKFPNGSYTFIIAIHRLDNVIPQRQGPIYVEYINKGNLYALTSRFVKALHYLIDEGKLSATISNDEWYIQVLVGTAGARVITLNTNK